MSAPDKPQMFPLWDLIYEPDAQTRAVFDVLDERERQDAKFGDQTAMPIPEWMLVLAEEFGEAAKDALDTYNALRGPEADRVGDSPAVRTAKNFRTELIQTAAVAVAMIEAGDKMGWWPKENA